MPIFWQKGPMAEETQQYEKGRERKQQSKDHQARMTRIMVHRPTKQKSGPRESKWAKEAPKNEIVNAQES